MLERGKMDRGVIEIVDTESLVPKGHLLRKIDEAVDFNRLYEMVEPLYSEDNGRPSVDPVVLFKMVLIQHLYGLPSLRRTADEISANICYRWFLGYTLQEETPHFSTVSYNFRHRFTAETVDEVFAWILEEVAEAGYLSPKAVFIDGTHIKANANTKKQIKEQVPVASKHYAKELMEEVNADREAHGKKPFDDDDEPPKPPKKCKDNTSKKKLARRKKEKTRIVTQSVTDPDCGLFVKGSHERQFAYEAHTACDSHGFVLETVVTPGNVFVTLSYTSSKATLSWTFPGVTTVSSTKPWLSQAVWASYANCRSWLPFTNKPQSGSVTLFVTICALSFFRLASFFLDVLSLRFFGGFGGSSSSSKGFFP